MKSFLNTFLNKLRE